jgi:hypothetical protein
MCRLCANPEHIGQTALDFRAISVSVETKPIDLDGNRTRNEIVDRLPVVSAISYLLRGDGVGGDLEEGDALRPLERG